MEWKEWVITICTLEGRFNEVVFLCSSLKWSKFQLTGLKARILKTTSNETSNTLVTLVCYWVCKTTQLYVDYEIFNRNPYQSTRITRDVCSPVLTTKWQINNNVRLVAIQDITVTFDHCISEQLFKDFHCFDIFSGYVVQRETCIVPSILEALALMWLCKKQKFHVGSPTLWWKLPKVFSLNKASLNCPCGEKNNTCNCMVIFEGFPLSLGWWFIMRCHIIPRWWFQSFVYFHPYLAKRSNFD